MDKEYSLWLIPSGDAYKQLTNLISQLSERFSSPRFEPHVTLLNKILEPEEKIIDKTIQLANAIRSYDIKLTTVDYLENYFKCLFIRVEKTEEVLGANLRAREIFDQYYVGQNQNEEYMPHLSLMYGNFPPQTKEEIIGETKRDFNATFKVEKLHLFLTAGEVKDWRKIKEVILD